MSDTGFVQPACVLHKKLILLHREPYITVYEHGGDRVLQDTGEQEFHAERRDRTLKHPMDRIGLTHMVLLREQHEMVFSREITDLGLTVLGLANSGISWNIQSKQACMDASRAYWADFIKGNSLNNVTLRYLSNSTAPELADLRRRLTYELMQRTPTAHAWIRHMKKSP